MKKLEKKKNRAQNIKLGKLVEIEKKRIGWPNLFTQSTQFSLIPFPLIIHTETMAPIASTLNTIKANSNSLCSVN